MTESAAWGAARDIIQDIEDEVLEHAHIRPANIDWYIERMMSLPTPQESDDD